MFKSIISFSLMFNYVIAKVSIDDLKQMYFEMIVTCSHEFPLGPNEVVFLKNKQMFDSENVRCLFACAYKKAGMMDDHGMLSVEGVLEVTTNYLSDYPEQLEKAKQFTEACKHVNDVKVNDGNKGCERAALIFNCSVEKAPEFDFMI